MFQFIHVPFFCVPFLLSSWFWYYFPFSLNSQNLLKIYESESYSVLSDTLLPHGLYSPWNSPGHNTRVGSLFLGDLPNPGIEPRSPALQVDSLQAELPGKPSTSPLQPAISFPGIDAKEVDTSPEHMHVMMVTAEFFGRDRERAGKCCWRQTRWKEKWEWFTAWRTVWQLEESKCTRGNTDGP